MTATDEMVKTLAGELSAAFETRKRDNGNSFVCLADGSPKWMTEVIHAAHGDQLPDDHIYSFCEKAADAISECDGADEDSYREAIDEIEPPIYTAEQMRWFAENWEYCDQAIEEGLWESGGKTGYGANSSTVTDLVAIGMQLHIREVGYALLDALTAEAESREE